MPYSPLVSIVGSSVHTSGKRKNAIHRITVHCAVSMANLETMVAYFRRNDRGASCNYCIGPDGRIAAILGEEYRSYCSSSDKNDEQAICIECACATNYPYTFPDATYEAVKKLCADICQRNGKDKLIWIENKQQRLAYQPADNEMVITCHRDFYDTACPGEWMYQHEAELALLVTEALRRTEPEPEPEPEQPAGLQALDLAGKPTAQIVDTIGPLCTEDQRKTGILASITMAQMILESGYCSTELAKAANNLFGMKTELSGNTWPDSAWDGDSVYLMDTEEWINGTRLTLNEAFRKYPNIEASIADHSAYLRGALKDGAPRYAGLVGCTDYKQAAQIIKDGGYATAPEYVSQLCHLIEIWGLTKWDVKDEPQEEQDEQQEPLCPSQPDTEYKMIPLETWNAMKAAAVVLYQAVKKIDDVEG